MSCYQLKTISHQQYQEWFNRHLQLLKRRTPFHHPAWLESVARGQGFDLGYIAICQGAELVAAVPGFLTRVGPFRAFGSPLRGTVTSYLGPVGLDLPSEPQGLPELIITCGKFAQKQWGVKYARFTLRDVLPQNGLAVWPNWSHTRAGSYRLDLCAGEEAIWAGMESDCRRNIRRAQRVGIETLPLRDAQTFYRMLEETLQRRGDTNFHSLKYFEQLLSVLVPKDLLWAWAARYEGQIIAGGLFLHDDQEAIYLSGASFPQYGSLPTSYLLHWKAIQTAARGGLRAFNSDASHIRSIDQFKEAFGLRLDHRSTLTWRPGYLRYAQKNLLPYYLKLRRLRQWALERIPPRQRS